MQRNHTNELAILNSAAMHILDFWVRVIAHPSSAAILNSAVQWVLNLRPGWKNETMRMVSISGKSQNMEPWRPALTHSPFTYAPARLNRSPHIPDAGG